MSPFLPSTSSKSFSPPSRLDLKSTRFPSGETHGLKSEGPSVSGCASPPSGDTRHMRPTHSNTRNDPSGARDGEAAKNISDQSLFAASFACAAKTVNAAHIAYVNPARLFFICQPSLSLKTYTRKHGGSLASAGRISRARRARTPARSRSSCSGQARIQSTARARPSRGRCRTPPATPHTPRRACP